MKISSQRGSWADWGVFAALSAAIAMLGACSHSLVEQRWGEAHTQLVSQMTADPTAGQQDTGPIPLDSDTGELIAEGYRKMQERQAPTSVPSIIQIDAQ